MRETLEDLYYGNITPYERQIRSGTSLMEAMEQSQECEEQLTKLLEGEAHSLLLRLINAENEIGSTLALENFILGFRLGTRLILEALDEDDGSLMSCVDKKDTFAKHCATRLCGISMKIFQKSKSDFRTPDQ